MVLSQATISWDHNSVQQHVQVRLVPRARGRGVAYRGSDPSVTVLPSNRRVVAIDNLADLIRVTSENGSQPVWKPGAPGIREF